MARDLKDFGHNDHKRGHRGSPDRKSKKGKRFFLAGLLVLLFLFTMIIYGTLEWGPGVRGWILDSRYFKIDNIEITGVNRADMDEIEGEIGVTTGESVLKTDLRAIRDRIMEVKWVKEVDVIRDLPSSLVIEIEEYVPVGSVITSDGMLLVDASGELVDIRDDKTDYAIFSGMDTDEELMIGAGLMRSLIVEGVVEIDSVLFMDYDEVMGYTIYTQTGVEVRFGHSPFEEKITLLITVLPDIQERGPIDYIYLDIDRRVVLKTEIPLEE